ncbi:MAG TPA: hypothetical protein VNJ54_15170 [Plantibacter sp.]|uniref:hypothetical protein n=1 Tax=Plantibacter sp. TaxID=1871045 RepID=UPI002CE53E4B|nr:hypothetical protein [Plantibacter sp.]
MSGLPAVIPSGKVIISRPEADTVLLFDEETGELVDMAGATVEHLAAIRAQIMDDEDDQKAAKRALDWELHRRMDEDNKLTLHAAGWEITGKAEKTAQWDLVALETALAELVDDGKLTQDAARRALKPTVVLKPAARDLDKLAKRFPAVEACRTEVPQARRATVRRAGA